MKFMFRILPPILLVLSLSAVPSITASELNSGRISGSIRNPSGSPLRDAFINIFKSATQKEFLKITRVRSNKDGLFRVSNLTPGVYFMKVSHEGYQAVSTEIFEVGSNRTTTLNISLQHLINYISNEDDPRNWNLKTVMRSSSDRRMIFRYLSARGPDFDAGEASPFSRNATMRLASNTFLGNQKHLNRHQTSPNGIVTNFAFAEPLSRNSRMIFSGQFDYGRSSFWRMRDTIHYRSDDSHDYKVSFGFGRMNLDYPGKDSLEASLTPEDQNSGGSWVRTIAFGLEATTRFHDILAINYGFDYSRLYYGKNQSFVYPSLEIVLSPSKGWSVTTSFTSRHKRDRNSVMLSTGEVLDLSEPTLITVAGDSVSMSQVRHSEIAIEKTISRDTALEVAVYRDNLLGPGMPLMITTITPENQSSRVINLNEDRSSQQGMRITLDRRILFNLDGSLTYGYGEATNVIDVAESIPIRTLNSLFRAYTRQQFHHSITGQLDATIPNTHTNLLTTIHWYPGNTLSPIDWLSDSMEIGSKSLNFEIRQLIPVQNFLIDTGRWEILLDLRNVLNQGEKVIPAAEGVVVLNRNPRSLRFGLNLNFH
ncbi:MAG: carboxypeptidase-like regulatory domain-containing protein [Acidobacteriota bacterium]|jgi:hypothetical protein